MSPSIPKFRFIHNTNDLFHIYAFVPAGSIYETKDFHGASHLLEHMQFKNTGDETSNISRELTFMGGKYNAATSKDVTFYYIKTDMAHALQAIRLLHQIVGRCNFTQRDLDTERKVVMEEYNQTADNVAFSMESLTFGTLMQEDNPYIQSVIGTKKVLQKVSAQRLKAYYRERYSPDKMTVMVNCPRAGLPKVRRTLARAFGKDAPASREPVADLQKNAAITEPKVIVLGQPTKQNILRMVFSGYDAVEVKKNMIMEFISYVLTGSGLYSVLNHSVREKRGLVYTVQSFVEPYQYCGMFTIQIASSHKDMAYVLSLAMSSLFQLAKHGLSPTAFKQFKASFISTLKMKFANEEFRTEWHGVNHFYGDMTRQETYMRYMTALTRAQFQAACAEIFDFERMGILCVGDFSNPNKTSLALMDILQSYRKMSGGVMPAAIAQEPLGFSF